MGYFFDYLNIHQKDPEECLEILTQKAKMGLNWIINAIFKYIQVHKSRVERKEISSATIRNYVKPIRLYCDQRDIPVPVIAVNAFTVFTAFTIAHTVKFNFPLSLSIVFFVWYGPDIIFHNQI